MLGFVSGIILAVWFKNEGPQRPVYDWMEEDEDENGSNGEEENKEKQEGKTKV
jgi:hypothetical protein